MTSSMNWPPEAIAQYDQVMAAGDETLNKLLATLRQGISVLGEQQAMAEVSRVIMERDNRDFELDLLVAALHRLATQPGNGTAE